jgi:hypothetical protein
MIDFRFWEFREGLLHVLLFMVDYVRKEVVERVREFNARLE